MLIHKTVTLINITLACVIPLKYFMSYVEPAHKLISISRDIAKTPKAELLKLVQDITKLITGNLSLAEYIFA